MSRAAVVIVPMVLGLAGCGSTSPNATPAAGDSHTSSPHPPAATQVSHAGHSCQVRQLRARVATSGSEASQPFATIALTNRGSRSCTLRGYPGLAAFGHAESETADKRLAIRTTHIIYERVDRGPRLVVVRPAEAASFSVGTATAYDGGVHLVTITALHIIVPGTAAPITLQMDMLASGPEGRPIPVGVTAFQAGIARR